MLKPPPINKFNSKLLRGFSICSNNINMNNLKNLKTFMGSTRKQKLQLKNGFNVSDQYMQQNMNLSPFNTNILNSRNSPRVKNSTQHSLQNQKSISQSRNINPLIHQQNIEGLTLGECSVDNLNFINKGQYQNHNLFQSQGLTRQSSSGSLKMRQLSHFQRQDSEKDVDARLTEIQEKVIKLGIRDKIAANIKTRQKLEGQGCTGPSLKDIMNQSLEKEQLKNLKTLEKDKNTLEPQVKLLQKVQFDNSKPISTKNQRNANEIIDKIQIYTPPAESLIDKEMLRLKRTLKLRKLKQFIQNKNKMMRQKYEQKIDNLNSWLNAQTPKIDNNAHNQSVQQLQQQQPKQVNLKDCLKQLPKKMFTQTRGSLESLKRNQNGIFEQQSEILPRMENHRQINNFVVRSQSLESSSLSINQIKIIQKDNQDQQDASKRIICFKQLKEQQEQQRQFKFKQSFRGDAFKIDQCVQKDYDNSILRSSYDEKLSSNYMNSIHEKPLQTRLIFHIPKLQQSNDYESTGKSPQTNLQPNFFNQQMKLNNLSFRSKQNGIVQQEQLLNKSNRYENDHEHIEIVISPPVITINQQ
eukprot:403353497